MRQRILFTLSALIALIAAAVVVPVSPAQADGSYDLGLTGFAEMVVDEAHGHIFISQTPRFNDLPKVNEVVVATLSGKLVTTLTNVSGARGMALSEDGATLWIALSGGDALAAVDTATLAVTKHATGPNTCPLDVAFTQGRVWYTHACDLRFPTLSTLDPVTFAPVGGQEIEAYGGHITAHPAVPGVIFGSDWGTSPTVLRSYGVTASPFSVTALHSAVEGGGSMAFSPDGSTIYSGEGTALSTGDLSLVRTVYTANNLSDAVAVRADGMIAIGRVDGSYLQQGDGTGFRNYAWAGQDFPKVVGLAFGPTLMYAVVTGNSGQYRLRVVTPKKISAVSITVDQGSYKYGQRATVTAKLSTRSPNREVLIYAIPFGGTKTLVKRGNVDATGRLTATYPVSMQTTFQVSYFGDAEYDAATALVSRRVTALVEPTISGHYGRSGDYYLVRGTSTVSIKARLKPVIHEGDCLYFTAQYRAGAWYDWGYTGCVRVDANGYATANLTGRTDLVGVPLRLRAEWRGDSWNLPSNSDYRYVLFTP